MAGKLGDDFVLEKFAGVLSEEMLRRARSVYDTICPAEPAQPPADNTQGSRKRPADGAWQSQQQAARNDNKKCFKCNKWGHVKENCTKW